MTTYLTADELFPTPVFWFVVGTEEWLHTGHVDEATINPTIAVPNGPVFSPLVVEPGSCKHQWMRFAEHDPVLDCEPGHCICRASCEDGYMWSEETGPGAEGALPVTWFLAVPKCWYPDASYTSVEG